MKKNYHKDGFVNYVENKLKSKDLKKVEKNDL